MASQRIVASKQLPFPVNCKCGKCGAINGHVINIQVSGSGIMGGSPFGRKERAEAEAQQHLLQNMAYHIESLYKECDKKSSRLYMLMNGASCPACGEKYAWTKILEEAAANKPKGLFAGLSKKAKEGKKQTEEALGNIAQELYPVPALSKDELIKQCGLEGVKAEPDMETMFIYMN